jgi:hypothetical protein
MDTKHQLRLNAYSVTADGKIECHREGRDDERIAVLRIDLARDSKAGRDIVERLLGLIDEPRALRGTAKSGSAVLLFKCGKYNPVPSVQGDTDRTGVFKMATHDGEVRFTITCASHGQTLDPSAYAWLRGRNPLEIDRDRLPVLTDDTGKAVIEAALKLGSWASQIDQELAAAARLDQLKADLAAGKIKILSEEEEAAAEDDALVAAHVGEVFEAYDGNMAALVLRARRRVARRKAAAEEARFAALTPEAQAAQIQAREDAATVERHQNSQVTESDGELASQIIQARARHSARHKAQAAT